MALAGQTIDNPVAGDAVTFVALSASMWSVSPDSEGV
jgi:hypothetical protein